MEKRLFLAIALSLLVVFMFSKPQPVQQQAIEAKNSSNTTETLPNTELSTDSKKISGSEKKKNSLPENLWTLSIEKSKIEFLESQAAIRKAVFEDYQQYEYDVYNSFTLSNTDAQFVKTFTSPERVVFSGEDQDKIITKVFNFSKDSYSIGLEISIKNKGTETLREDLGIVLGTLNFELDKNKNKSQVNLVKDCIMSSKDEVVYPNPKKDYEFNNIKFIGIRERYFCLIMQPYEENFKGYVQNIDKTKSEVGILEKNVELVPGKEVVRKFSLFLGPQDVKIIKGVNKNWTSIIYYGKLDIIAQVLMFLLDAFYKLTHNWGAAILIFSFAIYLILWPLSFLQMRSMKEMQLIQPKLEELRIKFKDDPQRFTKEQMLLFQEHKINPFGGCFFLILQIPVFITLYQVLTRTVMLKGAKFLWINDLTMPDRLFVLPFGGGFEVNLLPILMCVGMMIQSRITYVPQSAGTNQDQQKMMMFLMPLILLVAFYKMPSGVNLYWVTNNILMLIYQIKVVKSKK